MKLPMRRIMGAFHPAGEEAHTNFEHGTTVGDLYQVDFKPLGEDSTETQMGTFWLWMKTLADYFNTKPSEAKKLTKDDIHDLVCHKFLGWYEKKVAGEMRMYPVTLTKPKKKTKQEKSEFLSKIDAWAIGLGCYLPTRKDSEYQQYKEANQ